MSYKLIKSGKVRDVMLSDDGERIGLVASDQVSAFDQILPVSIPDKGKILTKLSAFWFRKTSSIVPNAYIIHTVKPKNSVLSSGNPDNFNCTYMENLQMLPIEAIVRGNITGSLWEAYHDHGTREFCGLSLPEGLENSQELPDYIFTPTTKAPQGEHDQNLSYDEMIDYLSQNGFDDAPRLASQIRRYSFKLFDYGRNYARERGIIIADSKFEFGLDSRGHLCLGDELFTPDSSRFWPVDQFEVGHNQPSFDKQIIRDWLKTHPDTKSIPSNIIAETRDRYIKAYELLTGEKFA